MGGWDAARGVRVVMQALWDSARSPKGLGGYVTPGLSAGW